MSRYTTVFSLAFRDYRSACVLKEADLGATDVTDSPLHRDLPRAIATVYRIVRRHPLKCIKLGPGKR